MTQSQTTPLGLPSDAYQALTGIEAGLRASSLGKTLMELVKMRASQINGCAFCLDMHSHDSRRAGETEQRLHVLAGWREAPFYTERERAGKLKSAWSLMPGAGARTAYLLIALALVQVFCPLLFADGTQWLVSGGVVLVYGWMLFQQLRAKLKANGAT